MNKLVTLPALLALFVLCTPVQAQNAAELRQLADRAAIEEVMMKYVWTVDSLDADGYVSVFTDDAEIHTTAPSSRATTRSARW